MMMKGVSSAGIETSARLEELAQASRAGTPGSRAAWRRRARSPSARRRAAARDDAREEERPDRDREDAAPDDHQDRGRDDHREDRGDRGDRHRERQVVALLGLRLDEHLALARRVRRRGARDPGEEDRQQHVHLRQRPGEVAHHGARQVHQPVGDAADVHQVRGEQEERHREQDERVVGLEGLVEERRAATGAARSPASAGTRARARTRPARAHQHAEEDRRRGSARPTRPRARPRSLRPARDRCATSCRTIASPRKSTQVSRRAARRRRWSTSAARRSPRSGPSRSARTRCPTRRTPARSASTTGAGDDAQQRIGPRRQLGPHVDLEVGLLAHPDHRAQHDHPDEEEARELLGPDVARDAARCSARRSAA